MWIVTKVLKKAETALYLALRNIEEAAFRWPSKDTQMLWGQSIEDNYVGSWNDAEMSRGLQDILRGETVLEGHGLVADTAFPVGHGLEGKIISPLKEDELNRAHPHAVLALAAISTEITSLRQAYEWGVGSVEKAFRQLLLPLPYDKRKRNIRLTNIFRLWNVRVRTTGISQIRNVFNAV